MRTRAPAVLSALRGSLEASAERIAADIEALSGPEYTLSSVGITRHAYTDAYRHTLEYFERAFADLGFSVHLDPVGNFVASNREPGAECIGLGSHCDANRNGGAYDGTLGVVCALEVCRLARERSLDLPLRVISFLEEEGSGFGETLLGSRIMLGEVEGAELEALSDEHGVAFPDAARGAGLHPESYRESARELDGMRAWLELHIEQGRLLEDGGTQLGIVTAIAGCLRGEMVVEGRADHAGGTPMDRRSDPLVTAAEVIMELEEMARESSDAVVSTVGELEVRPGLSNVIPGSVRLSLDLRSVSDAYLRLWARVQEFAHGRAVAREQEVRFEESYRIEPTELDPGVATALREVAEEVGATQLDMFSGAAHDTMLVARRVPAAMLFVPCVDGISHSPEESADPADAAVGAHVMLGAVERLVATG